jgi:hypothetical protein
MQEKYNMERLARLTLKVVCDYPIECLICDDKPDLQDAIHSYGIEVVEDCYHNERKAERFISGVWQKQVSKIKPEQIKRLEELGGSITEENGVVASASLGATQNGPTHLIDTIKKKVEKLNSGGYDEFAQYGLYVFVDTVFLFDSYVHSVTETIAEYQADRTRVYETIYLDGSYEMCVCDMRQKSFVRKQISREDKEKIREKLRTQHEKRG